MHTAFEDDTPTATTRSVPPKTQYHRPDTLPATKDTVTAVPPAAFPLVGRIPSTTLRECSGVNVNTIPEPNTAPASETTERDTAPGARAGTLHSMRVEDTLVWCLGVGGVGPMV